MKIVLQNGLFGIWDRVIIGKNALGHFNLQLADGESFICIGAGSRGRVLRKLYDDYYVVELDKGKWHCQVLERHLTKVVERSEVQLIDPFSMPDDVDFDL